MKTPYLPQGLRKGFTLVEMIVSLAVFSVVAVVALTALMSIMAANRKAQTLQSAITNLSYAMESLSREMRVGTKYYCDEGPGFSDWDSLDTVHACITSNVIDDTGAVVAFNSSKTAPSTQNSNGVCNLIYAYRLEPNTAGTGYLLKKAEQTSCHNTPPPDAFASVIDESVIITDYHLYVTDAGVFRHPYAILRLSGYTGDREKDRTYFDLQTAVSARTP
jgi:prepilin-type N-terminal cleavage/methylation domain-containing protein